MNARRNIRRIVTLLSMSILLATLHPTRATACAGDCSGDRSVDIGELIVLVSIALGSAQLSSCAAGDANANGALEINELIAAVGAALEGCPTGDPAAAALAV